MLQVEVLDVQRQDFGGSGRSRSGMSRRDSRRWIVALATARVSSALSLRRSASAGTIGAAQCFLGWHQVSHEVTAARSRFQVAGARIVPHSCATAR
ncbi:hypothetical protein BKM31_14425 [[Actinomadura] parvosata subsp. kistnae]|uniref:Uncharacterized protein n=1 Tax=[Actinomadura] parvosata subsp. kistnae TaxID=1909395 RepID=A0A1U9ZX30_9ACTN|nr:hypothetical protein BKM31_14425 [Nonomuraea sp. ATCC 55076]